MERTDRSRRHYPSNGDLLVLGAATIVVLRITAVVFRAVASRLAESLFQGPQPVISTGDAPIESPPEPRVRPLKKRLLTRATIKADPDAVPMWPDQPAADWWQWQGRDSCPQCAPSRQRGAQFCARCGRSLVGEPA
jgi:hypothetical protein